MKRAHNLTEGNIFASLTHFAMPVLLALFVQALYGGIDLLIVGQFSTTADISGVATGSLLMQPVTMIIIGLAMGITVVVGQYIGEGNPEKAGEAIGSGICFFCVFAIGLTAFLVFGADLISRFMQAPEEAFEQTSAYIRICGAGSAFIIAYNVLGSIFRGLGDSRTPLITVIIACCFNVVGDLLLVAGFHMGAAGAALATVLSQGVSVLISFLFITKRPQPFTFSRKSLRFDRHLIGTECKLGVPIALQELLVGLSFLVIQMIINSMGVVASAGVGVAERLCTFIMLVPSAYSQSLTAFVAQNAGAKKPKRASKGLFYGVVTASVIGLLMGYVIFFHGDTLSAVFSGDPAVVDASHSYLKAYAVECVLMPFLFCFTGYCSGYGKTFFVMVQGIIGAFCVRIPVAFFVSRISGATLFHIALATPASTAVQIILCLLMFYLWQRRQHF